MALEAVGIGDLHLTDESGKGGLSNYVENCDEYVMTEVDRVLAWARKRNIGNCFLYGDVCENPRMSYDAQIAFSSCIKRNPDIRFFLIPGNHDKLGADSSLGHSLQLIMLMDLPNLKVFTETTVHKIDGKRVRFCPWPEKKFDREVLNVGHVEVKGSRSDSGRKFEDATSASKAVTLMGHLHTPHKVRNTYYSGTLYQTNFGERLPKGFHHIVWNNADDYEILDIPFEPRYKLHNCIIETEADVAALPRGATDLIKLVVKDGADLIVPQLPNIVITKVFKTKQDLQQILTEDLTQGHALEIKTSSMFREWLEHRKIEPALLKRVMRKRLEVLRGEGRKEKSHGSK